MNEKFWGYGRYLSAYGDFILEATALMNPVPQAVDTHQIEEVMRTQHSTLDHLRRGPLAKLAREAWLAVQELRSGGTYETPPPECYPPPEPGRSGGIQPSWVMTRAQYEALPDSKRRHWVWELLGDTATGRKRDVDLP